MTPAERARNIYDNNIKDIEDAAHARMLLALPGIINDIEDRARAGYKTMKYNTDETIHFVVALQKKLTNQGFIVQRHNTTQPDKQFLITW